MTVIQRYAGLNAKNCEIWVDTHFASLDEANRTQPDHIYRRAFFDAVQTPTYWGDTSTVGIKPCCDKHAA